MLPPLRLTTKFHNTCASALGSNTYCLCTMRIAIVILVGAWASPDPDTSRIWWEDVGVHQNLTHAVHPDPLSGAHCWHQRAVSVRKAADGERHGDVQVDVQKSMAVYREWLALARSAVEHSPDGTRRPYWLKRPLKPVREAYDLPRADDDCER